MNECILYDNFTPEKTNIALTTYYDLESFMEYQMGKVSKIPVSLVDVYPTILEGANIKVPKDRPGESLSKLANEEDNADRVVFSEYHVMGTVTRTFMIKKGNWRFVHYV